MSQLERFVQHVRCLRSDYDDPALVLAEASAPFESILDPALLPLALIRSGSRVVRYLLHASEAVTIFAIASPSGYRSEVHDHGSWGLVGQVIGKETERVYRQVVGFDDFVSLELVSTRRLRPGDVTAIAPPERDIHQVATVGTSPSVTIHAFANDPVHSGFTCFEPRLYEPRLYALRLYRGSYDNET